MHTGQASSQDMLQIKYHSTADTHEHKVTILQRMETEDSASHPVVQQSIMSDARARQKSMSSHHPQKQRSIHTYTQRQASIHTDTASHFPALWPSTAQLRSKKMHRSLRLAPFLSAPAFIVADFKAAQLIHLLPFVHIVCLPASLFSSTSRAPRMIKAGIQ